MVYLQPYMLSWVALIIKAPYLTPQPSDRPGGTIFAMDVPAVAGPGARSHVVFPHSMLEDIDCLGLHASWFQANVRAIRYLASLSLSLSPTSFSFFLPIDAIAFPSQH
jgi:hypothetical protein